MKKLESKIWVKVIAIIVLASMFIISAASGVAAVYLNEHGGYDRDFDIFRADVLENAGFERSYRAMHGFISGQNLDSLNDGAFCYTVKDEDGNVVYDSLKGREPMWQSSEISIQVDKEQQNWDRVTVNDGERCITVPSGNDGETVGSRQYSLTGYILADYSGDQNITSLMAFAGLAYENRYNLIVSAVAAFLVGVIAFIFLMASAGHRENVDGIHLSGVDRIPFDVFSAGCVFISECVMGVMPNLNHARINAMTGTLFTLELLVLGFILLDWCMSLAVRIKTHTVLSGCLCYKILAWCLRVTKKFLAWQGGIIRNLPLVKKTAVITAVILLVEFLYTCASNSTGAHLFGWFIERIVLVTGLLYSVVLIQKLREGARQIADGNISFKVDTSKMYGPFKAHGEDLNAITDGLNKAVSERMKSERFRTELITNVSHDIKTPLTSIINYVDLLEKEKPENEKMQEYLEVLERQSGKLKKLIEDLLEASKASTGNLSVELRPCDLGVLLDQCTGEYRERLAEKGLALVTEKPEQPLVIMADGRHMWRILDNLLNNVYKYSQSGTRVYLTVEKTGDKATVKIKNISEGMLNVTAEELMERFVRGDTARTTEGSGLGLNISKSLAQLQGGELDVTVDGDLFKVTLSFPEAK